MIHFSDVGLLESWDDETDFNYCWLLSLAVSMRLLFQALEKHRICKARDGKGSPLISSCTITYWLFSTDSEIEIF